MLIESNMGGDVYVSSDRSETLQKYSYCSGCKVARLSKIKDNFVFEVVLPNKKQGDMDGKKREVKKETPQTEIE